MFTYNSNCICIRHLIVVLIRPQYLSNCNFFNIACKLLFIFEINVLPKVVFVFCSFVSKTLFNMLVKSNAQRCNVMNIGSNTWHVEFGRM